MVKIFKIIIIGILLVIVGLVCVTTYQFHTFTPKGIEQNAVPQNLTYFQESYGECRKAFVDLGNEQNHPGKGISAIRVESQTDNDLTINYCYLPALNSFKRLIILTSAVHGVEGYVGSAVQQMVLKEMTQKINFEDLGILLVHGVNPFGFKHNRRFTENNVDLNRNCSIDVNLFSSVNPGYNDLNEFLNPNKTMDLSDIGHYFFQILAIEKIIRHSMGSLRQAVLQGQYQHPNGIYFGGKSLEPGVLALTQIIQELSAPYDRVFCIDLHTGYGTNGVMHLFPNPIEDKTKRSQLEQIFSGTSIDWGDSDDFYTTTGDFATYLGSILPEADYLNMAFEFGTLDTHTTMGSIRALHHVIIENQGFHHGYASRSDEEKTKDRYLAGYYPSSAAWRSKAIEDARNTLFQAIEKYQQIAP